MAKHNTPREKISRKNFLRVEKVVDYEKISSLSIIQKFCSNPYIPRDFEIVLHIHAESMLIFKMMDISKVTI